MITTRTKVRTNRSMCRQLAIGALYRLRHVLGARGGAAALGLLKCRDKRYIPPSLGVQGFFTELQKRGLSHVVLRWFEGLPLVDAGCDIDILVEDSEATQAESLLTSWPVGTPVDLYTKTGASGLGYKPHVLGPPAVPVFPPEHATRLLERAERQAGGWCVPATEDHFFSLAYHAVYLKGYASGLPPSPGQAPRGHSSRDYAAVLSVSARESGLELAEPLTLSNLDAMLAKHGWRPPLEMLERFGATNPWLREELLVSLSQRDPEHDGLTIFFLERKAASPAARSAVSRAIGDRGFELFAEIALTPDDMRLLERDLAPSPRFACAYVAFDALSKGPKTPSIDDRRQAKAAAFASRQVLVALDGSCRNRPVKSTRDSAQAWQIVRRLMPMQKQAELKKLIGRRRAEMETQSLVLADLTRCGYRAKIELIEFGDGIGLKKTFRHHCLRYLEREVGFLCRFGDRLSALPNVLEIGSNYFICEAIENCFRPRRKFGIKIPTLLPLRAMRELAANLKVILEEGFDPIDLSPGENVLIDRRTGALKMIDWEFVLDRGRPIAPEESYCLTGIPEDFEGDFPYSFKATRDPYSRLWIPYLGLPRDSFLYDPAWAQRLKRMTFFPAWLILWAVRGASRKLGKVTSLRWRALHATLPATEEFSSLAAQIPPSH